MPPRYAAMCIWRQNRIVLFSRVIDVVCFRANRSIKNAFSRYTNILNGFLINDAPL
jgi:hypothetical protein